MVCLILWHMYTLSFTYVTYKWSQKYCTAHVPQLCIIISATLCVDLCCFQVTWIFFSLSALSSMHFILPFLLCLPQIWKIGRLGYWPISRSEIFAIMCQQIFQPVKQTMTRQPPSPHMNQRQHNWRAHLRNTWWNNHHITKSKLLCWHSEA